MNINKLRKEIDGIDDKLLKLLNNRAGFSKRIGKMKSVSKKDIYFY